MKKLTICILGFFFTISNGYAVIVYSSNKLIHASDTTNYAILKSRESFEMVFQKSKPTELSSEDIKNIEILLFDCIKDYNTKGLKEFEKSTKEHPNDTYFKSSFIIDLTNYKRQYIAAINKKGEKEVWVNCFPANGRNFDYWKKEIGLP